MCSRPEGREEHGEQFVLRLHDNDREVLGLQGTGIVWTVMEPDIFPVLYQNDITKQYNMS